MTDVRRYILMQIQQNAREQTFRIWNRLRRKWMEEEAKVSHFQETCQPSLPIMLLSLESTPTHHTLSRQSHCISYCSYSHQLPSRLLQFCSLWRSSTCHTQTPTSSKLSRQNCSPVRQSSPLRTSSTATFCTLIYIYIYILHLHLHLWANVMIRYDIGRNRSSRTARELQQRVAIVNIGMNKRRSDSLSRSVVKNSSDSERDMNGEEARRLRLR